ncbi:MAG: hypothetical protein ACE5I1_12275, partial [bacterium]
SSRHNLWEYSGFGFSKVVVGMFCTFRFASSMKFKHIQRVILSIYFSKARTNTLQVGTIHFFYSYGCFKINWLASIPETVGHITTGRFEHKLYDSKGGRIF